MVPSVNKGKTASDLIVMDFHVYNYGERYDCHAFGLYRSTVGDDVTGGDIFENIGSLY